MMLTVNEPEEVELVARPVVEVEPVVKSNFPPTDLEGCSPRQAFEGVAHVAPPREEERTEGTEDGVDEDRLAEVVDVFVVDEVTTTILLVESAILSHVLVETSDHSNGKTDEAEVVHHPSRGPVHLVVRHSSVPCQVDQGRDRGGGEDEQVLFPDGLDRGRTTKGQIGTALLVAHVGGDIDTSNELPEVALLGRLKVPGGLGTNTVDLVVTFASDGVLADRLLAETERCRGSGFIAGVVGCDLGADGVGEFLVAHGRTGGGCLARLLGDRVLCLCGHCDGDGGV